MGAVPAALPPAGLLEAAAAKARQLDEQHLDNILFAALLPGPVCSAQVPCQHPAAATAAAAAEAAAAEAAAAQRAAEEAATVPPLAAGEEAAALPPAPPLAAAAATAAGWLSTGLPHVAALRQEVVRRLGSQGSRSSKGYTPTSACLARVLWALAVLQVGGQEGS